MPVEQGYESRVAPQEGPGPVLVNPDAMGAGLGRALEAFGNTAHQAEIRAYEIERKAQADQQLTQWTLDFAKWTTAKDGVRIALEEKPEVGGAGHTAAISQQLEDGDQLLQGISDDGVRRQAMAQLAEYRAKQLQRAQIFQMGQSAAQTTKNGNEAFGTLYNALSNGDGSDESLVEAGRQWGMFIGALNLGGQGTADMLKMGQGFLVAQAKALADRDPAKLGEKLQAGAFNRLSPEQFGQIERLYQVGAARVAAEQQQAAAAQATEQRQAVAQVNDAYEAFNLAIQNHEIPKSGDIAQLLEKAQAVGAPATLIAKIALLTEYAGAASVLATQSTRQIDDQYQALKQIQGSGQLSGAQARQLDRLDKELDARANRKGESLREIASAGPSGRVQAALELAKMSPDQAARVAEATGDPSLYVVSHIKGRAKFDEAQGRDLRKARPDDWWPAAAPGASKEKRELAARQIFDSVLGPVKANVGGAYEHLFQSAMNIMANGQNKAGSSLFDQKQFERAVRIVFGASLRADGKEIGGIAMVRGRQVPLPDGWTAEEFDQRYSRYDFAKNGAVYNNMQPADKADVLANWRPVFDGYAEDGATVLYRFENARHEFLMRKDHSPFRMPVALRPGDR